MKDYYQILGVPRNADANTLKSAYRKRALESHPDRGGSHEKMLLVNAAWEILSNPEKRRRHDEELSGTSTSTTAQAAQEDARQAYAHAENYPRNGAELESWLDAIAADFAKTQYPDNWEDWDKFGFSSVSGCLFLVIGAGLVIWLGMSMGLTSSDGIQWKGAIMAGIAGAIWLHQRLNPASGKNTTGSNIEGSTVLACPKCGTQLRIPQVEPLQHARCPNCKHEFKNT